MMARVNSPLWAFNGAQGAEPDFERLRGILSRIAVRVGAIAEWVIGWFRRELTVAHSDGAKVTKHGSKI